MAAVNADLFHKFQNVKRLRQAGDGTECQVDVREDEEQSIKLQEIIDLLLAAGYFRARIKGLSSFDKIVGGMTWCIESCNMDIDVDLLFQENSTIGQKIALTEKIVAVLPKMKCPHRIEPHQIQGLDFVHIWPVMQWLVKRSMEFREEMSSFVRQYAISQFDKQFPFSSKDVESLKATIENINTVRNVYRPQRYFKRKHALPEDMDSRIQITLLEYGLGRDMPSSSSKPEKSSSVEDSSEKLDFNTLLSMMTDTKQEQFEDVVLSKEEQQDLLKHYASLQLEMEDGGLKSKEARKRWALEQTNQLLLDKIIKVKSENEEYGKQIAEVAKELNTLTSKRCEADKILNELNENKILHAKNMEQVQNLIMLSDNLKAEEVQFREHCKEELARLKDLIDKAKGPKSPDMCDPALDEQLDKAQERIKQVRLQVAKKNRSVATLQRKIDDVPSRAELAQYQKRFLELYNQVAAKHRETKQYYTLYNTLEETRMYISKELSLLNSICDSYPEAMLSASGREEFIHQFENIVEGVKQSKAKVLQKLNEEKSKRDRLACCLQNLNEKQRQYVAAVRQLGLEFRKHEALLAGHTTQ